MKVRDVRPKLCLNVNCTNVIPILVEEIITYGHRAADLMRSESIKRQLKPLWGRLQDEIEQ